MLSVKVLGPGCPNCSKLEAITKQAVASMGMEVQYEKISNYKDIMKYPILATPALVINEKVVCSGRLPTPAEVTTWLANAAMETE